MATTSPSTVPLPLPSATVRIEPPRGLFELRLREVWAYRELLYFFVWRDVKIRYKQTAIGVLWVILQPVLNMLVFTLFFGRLAKLPSDGLPYPVFYFSALVPWTYFAYSLLATTNVVVENQRLITKVYFPRLILPISTALSGDVRYVIPFLVQFWMFASPVAYASSLVPARWRWLYGLNPMAGVIDGFRWALTGHGQPPGIAMAASAVGVGVVLLGGLFFFQRMEMNIADRV